MNEAAGVRGSAPGRPLVPDGLRADGKITAKEAPASAEEEAEEHY